VAEAFKFVGVLMDAMGWGGVVQGITSVLPSSSAAVLLERIDVGGWMSNYQERYSTWPREFSLGYCYMEYSMYNVANEGLAQTTNNILSRVFKSNPTPQSTVGGMTQGRNPMGHQPNVAPMDVLNGVPPPPQGPSPYGGGAGMNNFISPMPLQENSFNAYGQPGNRRVKRGVTVSRSYSAAAPSSSSSSSSGTPNGASNSPRRAVRRRLISRGRNVPPAASSSPVVDAPVPLIPVPEASSTTTTTSSPIVNHSNVSSFTQTLQNFHQSSSSFIPTEAQSPKSQNFFAPQPQQTHFIPQHYQQQYHPEQRSDYPQQFTYQQQQPSPLQRSHVVQQPLNPQILTEYARPRRHENVPHPPQSQPMSTQQGKGKEGGGPSSGAANLMNIANLLVSTAMSANNGGGGGGGDQVTNIMNTALPLVSQVANSPAIHSMVSNLVTSFLTPPNSNNKPRPPPPSPTPVQNSIDDEGDAYNDDSLEQDRPSSSKPPKNQDMDSNELDEPAISPSSNRPSNSAPPNNSGGGSGGGGADGSSIISSMMSQMIKTYISHLFGGSGGGGNKPSHSNNKPPSSSNPKPSSSDTDKIDTPEESKDIVDVLTNVAKPFFMSYFGIVPGEPGFGKLRIRDNRRDSEYIEEGADQDPGTGITDVIFGSVNLPETGNGVYDFGNRVVYAFSKANNPQQGMYCFKQYVVNKLWDGFRLGARAIFERKSTK
jgi:hypothetical protein